MKIVFDKSLFQFGLKYQKTQKGKQENQSQALMPSSSIYPTTKKKSERKRKLYNPDEFEYLLHDNQ